MFSFLGSQKDVTGGSVGVEEKVKEREPELFTYPQASAQSLPGFYSDSPPQLQEQLPQQDYSKSQPHLQAPPPIQTHTHPYSKQRSSTLPHAQPASLRVPPTYPYWYHNHTSSSASSQTSLDSPTTPSNIAWLSNGSSSSLAGGSQAQRQTNNNTHVRAPSIGRSLSSPASSPPTVPPPNSAPTLKASYFPPPPASSPSTTAPPISLPIPPAPTSISSGRAKLYAHAPGVSGYTYASGSKSSYSLRLPGQEDVFPTHAPLSPIVEQDYLSPEKRPVSLPTEGSSNSPSTPTMVTPVSQIMITPISPISPILVLSPATASASTPMLTPVSRNRRSVLPSPLTMRDILRDEDSPRPSPVFSSFLSRPLNRSHSLSSTRTQTSGSGRTPTSISPPVIPPLDLRPSFTGPIPLRTPTRGSSLGSSSRDPLSPAYKDPSTPSHREPAQSSKDLLSPSSAMNNGGEDDASSFRAESFVTAPSIQINGDGKANRVSVLPDGAKPLELDFERDYPQSIQPLLNDDFFYLPIPPEPAHTNSPPHFRSPSHTSSYPPSYSLPIGSTHDFQPNKSLASIPAASLRSSSTTSLAISLPSVSSSFIDRRFASNNASGAFFPLIRKRQVNERPSMPCIMFWLGFVAPWCWLIGGWLLGAAKTDRPKKPATVPWGASRSKHLLPLWTQGKSTVTLKSHSGLAYNGYPFVAPSAASLTPPLSSTAGHSSTPTIIRPNARKPLDPWVRRCRVAAVVGGIATAVVFIIALAAVGHN